MLTALDKEAARVFYAIPGVEEIRREDRGQSVTFWIRGNNLSMDAIGTLVDCGIALYDQFPDPFPMIEIHDRFGRELGHSSFWEELTPIPHRDPCETVS